MKVLGTYWVVAIGKRFLRFPESGIVGQYLTHAHQFDTSAAARATVAWLQAEMPGEKKPIRVVRVSIQVAPSPKPLPPHPCSVRCWRVGIAASINGDGACNECGMPFPTPEVN